MRRKLRRFESCLAERIWRVSEWLAACLESRCPRKGVAGSIPVLSALMDQKPALDEFVRVHSRCDYSFDNFFKETVANFTPCEMPERPPDFFSFSGSTYWDEGDRVIRWSNHWGKRISTCCWYLDFRELQLSDSVCGYCYYEDFRHKITLSPDYEE